MSFFVAYFGVWRISVQLLILKKNLDMLLFYLLKSWPVVLR